MVRSGQKKARFQKERYMLKSMLFFDGSQQSEHVRLTEPASLDSFKGLSHITISFFFRTNTQGCILSVGNNTGTPFIEVLVNSSNEIVTQISGIEVSRYAITAKATHYVLSFDSSSNRAVTYVNRNEVDNQVFAFTVPTLDSTYGIEIARSVLTASPNWYTGEIGMFTAFAKFANASDVRSLREWGSYFSDKIGESLGKTLIAHEPLKYNSVVNKSIFQNFEPTNTTTVNQSHTFVVGDPIYFDGSLWQLANGNVNGQESNPAKVVLSVQSSNEFKINSSSGVYFFDVGSHNLGQIGDVIYPDGTTKGTLKENDNPVYRIVSKRRIQIASGIANWTRSNRDHTNFLYPEFWGRNYYQNPEIPNVALNCFSDRFDELTGYHLSPFGEKTVAYFRFTFNSQDLYTLPDVRAEERFFVQNSLRNNTVNSNLEDAFTVSYLVSTQELKVRVAEYVNTNGQIQYLEVKSSIPIPINVECDLLIEKLGDTASDIRLTIHINDGSGVQELSNSTEVTQPSYQASPIPYDKGYVTIGRKFVARSSFFDGIMQRLEIASGTLTANQKEELFDSKTLKGLIPSNDFKFDINFNRFSGLQFPISSPVSYTRFTALGETLDSIPNLVLDKSYGSIPAFLDSRDFYSGANYEDTNINGLEFESLYLPITETTRLQNTQSGFSQNLYINLPLANLPVDSQDFFIHVSAEPLNYNDTRSDAYRVLWQLVDNDVNPTQGLSIHHVIKESGASVNKIKIKVYAGNDQEFDIKPSGMFTVGLVRYQNYITYSFNGYVIGGFAHSSSLNLPIHRLGSTSNINVLSNELYGSFGMGSAKLDTLDLLHLHGNGGLNNPWLILPSNHNKALQSLYNVFLQFQEVSYSDNAGNIELQNLADNTQPALPQSSSGLTLQEWRDRVYKLR